MPGSIHCHGLAKLKSDPGLVELSQVALAGFLAVQKVMSCKVKTDDSSFQE